MSDSAGRRVVDFNGLVSQARAADQQRAEPLPEPVVNAIPEGGEAGLPALEDLTPLPLPDDEYKAHANPVNQPQHMLCLLFRGTGYKLVSYGNLDTVDYEPSAEAGDGPAMLLLFTGLRPFKVRLTGKDVRPLGTHLRQHRIAWIREHPGGSSGVGGDGMVITGIHVTPLKD